MCACVYQLACRSFLHLSAHAAILHREELTPAALDALAALENDEAGSIHDWVSDVDRSRSSSVIDDERPAMAEILAPAKRRGAALCLRSDRAVTDLLDGAGSILSPGDPKRPSAASIKVHALGGYSTEYAHANRCSSPSPSVPVAMMSLLIQRARTTCHTTRGSLMYDHI